MSAEHYAHAGYRRLDEHTWQGIIRTDWGGNRVLWECSHLHSRQRHANGCAQEELDAWRKRPATLVEDVDQVVRVPADQLVAVHAHKGCQGLFLKALPGTMDLVCFDRRHGGSMALVMRLQEG